MKQGFTTRELALPVDECYTVPSFTDIGVYMQDEARQALVASINHWRRLRDAVRADNWRAADDEGYGGHQCALCNLYAEPWSLIRGVATGPQKHKCQGCPVAAAGHVYCESSPYKVAAVMLDNWLFYRNQRSHNKTLAAVEAELEFLEGLLPGDDHD